MLLIAFIPILWGLSTNVVIPFFKDISGSLVWVSLSASLGGLVISWLVGIKLPGLEYNNQRRLLSEKNWFTVKMIEETTLKLQPFFNYLQGLNLIIIGFSYIMVILIYG